jgi:hypothetical protein
MAHKHRTKWDVLQERLAKAREEVTRQEEVLTWLRNTPFKELGTDELGQCSKCHRVFPTEADFARHFLIPDERYLNIGYCPNDPTMQVRQ